MMTRIEKLINSHSLTIEEYAYLIENRNAEYASLLAEAALRVRRSVYGNRIYIRGLIEISNICKNDCLYCGIRHSNRHCQRYRLTKEQILDCCREGYALGFRSFVLQGGEDPALTDEWLLRLITAIKQNYADCSVTLSIGERSPQSYSLLRQAGVDRYLLRHETADKDHYAQLHPRNMSYDNRIDCLHQLKALGYQTGCGMMVGSPGQTPTHLAQDLKLIEQLSPQMCGIGPFIPHQDTPMGEETAGSVELTCYLLSIIRLIHPSILLPATTALGTLDPEGREKGILAGANVVMPNLSPPSVRKHYMLYNNKLSDGAESAQCLHELKERMAAIGHQIVTDRGDYKSIIGGTKHDSL